MGFLQTYAKEIISLLVPLLTWGLTFVKSKGRLQVGEAHKFAFRLSDPFRDAQGNITDPAPMLTNRIFVLLNVGRESVTKVELILNAPPQDFNVWPPRPHTVTKLQDLRWVIQFEYLAPREELYVACCSLNAPLPDMLLARSAEGLAKVIFIGPQRIFPKWIRTLGIIAIALGAATSVYLLMALLQWLVLETPLAWQQQG